MKNITEYIIERGPAPIRRNIKFVLSDDERDNLAEVLGYASESIGEKSDIVKFTKFVHSLTSKEREDLPNLYDVLDDRYNYPKFTDKILTAEDTVILAKLFLYLNNELDNEFDLSDVAETMGFDY